MPTIKTYFNDRLLCVRIPDGIPDTEDFGMEAGSCYNGIINKDGEYMFVSNPPGILPPVKTGIKVSEYQLLGTGSQVSEEVAKQILPTHIEPNEPVYYKMPDNWYDEPDHGKVIATTDVKKSWNAFLTANGIDKDKDILLLKIE